MNKKLIINFSSIIHLYADERNYILIFRESKEQTIKNGYHTYFQNLNGVFQEFFDHEVKKNLANDTDKTIKEVLKIINETSNEVLKAISPFEEFNSSSRAYPSSE